MGELSITCELLKRKAQWKIMGLLLAYIGIFILARILTPYYKNDEIVYQGLLNQFGYGEYSFYAQNAYIILLIIAPLVFIIILQGTLTIVGDITISERKILISKNQITLYQIYLNDMKKLEIQFNHFKRNDIEPRNMIKGNNNFIVFNRMGVTFRYEFLLQTKEEDEIFRAILDKWTENGIAYNYKTVLSDF
jgi:hypothetical protein